MVGAGRERLGYCSGEDSGRSLVDTRPGQRPSRVSKRPELIWRVPSGGARCAESHEAWVCGESRQFRARAVQEQAQGRGTGLAVGRIRRNHCGLAIGAGAEQKQTAWTRDDADDGTMGFAKTRVWEPENKDV